MNIAIFTNTFTPHVGGVARSVQAFTDEYRKMGHRTLVVAPKFDEMPAGEVDVVRIPAIQNFNTSDFSVALPIPQGLTQTLIEFEPEIIHSQHPFLLGMTAVRAARSLHLPLVFTHHTLYEEYTHYVPGDSALLRSFVIELATRYANLSDQVIAPSESIRDLLMERGVRVPIEVVPTGVHLEKFAQGEPGKTRTTLGIADDAFVVGHMGRLALEKNIRFLAASVRRFLEDNLSAVFLVVGDGDARQVIENEFASRNLSERLLFTGTLENQDLSNALNAMDVFAFASRTETQGMVLTEAMAAGLPVVALNASGAREVVRDEINGRLLEGDDEEGFADALRWVLELGDAGRAKLVAGARKTAESFSMQRSAQSALDCFANLRRQAATSAGEDQQVWEQLMGRIKAEWQILSSLASAGDDAISENHRG